MKEYKQISATISFRESSVSGECEGSLLGKDYYILPSIMMISGSYSPHVEGAREDETIHFSPSALEKSVSSWNGRPISLNHPYGFTTCNCPDVLNDQWMGYIFSAEFDHERKALKSKLWLAKDRGESILGRLRSGKNIDVSIGAFGLLEPSKENTEVLNMSEIVGDHLAILPFSSGACSWEDGCGIRMSSASGADAERCSVKWDESSQCWLLDGEKKDLLNDARSPSYIGTEISSWEDVNKTLSSFVDGYYKHNKSDKVESVTEVTDCPRKILEWISSKSLLGSSTASSFREVVFFPVVNPITNRLNKGALSSVLSGRGSTADIPSKMLDSARSKARYLLNKEFKDMSSSTHASIEKEVEEKKAVVSSKCYSVEEFVSAAPSGIRDIMEDALKIRDSKIKEEQEKKREVISEIVSFCDKNSLKVCKQFLNKSGIDDLGSIVDIIGVNNNSSSLINSEEKKVSDYSIKASSSNTSDNYGYCPAPVFEWN